MSDLRETQDYLAEVIADRDRLRAALERIAATYDMSIGNLNSRHVAESMVGHARAALAGDAKPEPRELLCDTCAAPLGIMAEPGMHGTCSRCAAKPASAPHRIPEVNDRACTHPKIQDGFAGDVDLGPHCIVCGASVQSSATSENPDAVCDSVAREGHAGARARQIDDVADAPPLPAPATEPKCPFCGEPEARHIAKAPGGKPRCIVRREKCTGQWRGNAMVVCDCDEGECPRDAELRASHQPSAGTSK